MATTSTIVEADPAAQVRLPVIPLIAAVAIGTLLSVSVVGGAGYYLIHSGKLKLQTAAPAPAVASTPLRTHSIALEPLTVNLADASGSAYLRVSMVLEAADTAPAAKPEAKESAEKESQPNAAVRDTALAVLGRQSADALLAPEGKELLKKQLKEALATRNPDLKLADLYFTEFLVQR
jgi:flagellar protein FliL